MNNFKVSVVIPVYNTEIFLEKCIISILEQTLEELEIIIINDGSTDNSHIICEKYAKKYPSKIVYINNKNCGCSASRNLGISLAKGEYISFIDSDDYVKKEMFEELYNKAKKEELEIVVCGIILHNLDGTKRYSIPKIPKNKYDYLSPKMKISNACNKLYKLDFLHRNKMSFLENIHCFEDLLFSFKCYVQTEKVGYLQKALYNYVFHGNNSVFNLEKRKDIFIAFNALYTYLNDNSFLLNTQIKRKFFENFHFYAIKGVYFLLLNPQLVSEKDYKKYSIIFTKELKKLKFLTLKSRFLIYFNIFFVFLIRSTNIYFILKKIFHFFKGEK